MLRRLQNLEQVLQNMNTLNRSLESVIAVRPFRYTFRYLSFRAPIVPSHEYPRPVSYWHTVERHIKGTD